MKLASQISQTITLARLSSRYFLLAGMAFAFLTSACAVETKRREDKSAEATVAAAPPPPPMIKPHLETQNVDQPTMASNTLDEASVVLKDAHGNIVHSKLAPSIAPPNTQEALPTTDSHQLQSSSHKVHTALQTTAALSATQHSAHRTAGPVPATQSLGWLKNGNTRFRKGFLRADGQSHKDVLRLAKGQKPHAIVVSCSDSRVPPEVVFDQKLGEIFVVRTAGQSLDSSAIASIEYAVEHLGSNLIVVMGHESCGAVKATLSAIKDKADLGSPYLNQLVSNIRPRIANLSARQPASEGLVMEGWENAKGASKELLTKSEIIRRAIESGDVKITSALYHLGTGEVEWSSNK